jgi:hypothetical protein
MQLYFRKDGLYGCSTEIRRIKHSDNTGLPTYLIDETNFEDQVAGAFSIGVGIMIANKMEHICLIGKNSLINYYLKHDNGRYSIEIESHFVVGPLYGKNLSSSY